MYEGRKVIVVMPAGRRRYMPLISHYLYQHKGLIDNIVLWCNTQDREDVQCLDAMAAKDPDFVRVQKEKDGPLGVIGNMDTIRVFYNRQMDPNAIYLRIDDDICYMHPDAIPNLVKFRHENPQYFCITANMVNSGLCSHIHDRMGLQPRLSRVIWESAGGDLHWSAEMAAYIHHYFLQALEANKQGEANHLDPWMCFERWELWENPRFGIAVTAYQGRDIHDFLDKWEGDGSDEDFFSRVWPAKIGRINCIAGKALVVHYAYGPQRANGMETKNTAIPGTGIIPANTYDRYKAIAGVQ